MLRLVAPIYTAELSLPFHRQLIALLRSLEPAEWVRAAERLSPKDGRATRFLTDEL